MSVLWRELCSNASNAHGLQPWDEEVELPSSGSPGPCDGSRRRWKRQGATAGVRVDAITGLQPAALARGEPPGARAGEERGGATDTALAQRAAAPEPRAQGAPNTWLLCVLVQALTLP